MKKGTLVRAEIYIGMALFAAMLALAGYGLIAAFADRLDPKVRECVSRQQAVDPARGRDNAVRLCRQLEAVGVL